MAVNMEEVENKHRDEVILLALSENYSETQESIVTIKFKCFSIGNCSTSLKCTFEIFIGEAEPAVLRKVEFKNLFCWREVGFSLKEAQHFRILGRLSRIMGPQNDII